MEQRMTLDQLNNDVLLNICSYLAIRPWLLSGDNPALGLSMVNKRLRSVCGVLLFRKLRVRDSNAGIATRLDRLAQDLGVAYLVKNLDLRSLSANSVQSAPPSIGRNLTSIINKMNNLVKLSIVVPPAVADAIRHDFQSSKVQPFTTVKVLVVGPGSDWLVALCPNIDSFAVVGAGAEECVTMLNSAHRKLCQIERVQVEDRKWTLEDVELLASKLSGIKVLALCGSMRSIPYMELTGALSKLNPAGLKELALPAAKDLPQPSESHRTEDDFEDFNPLLSKEQVKQSNQQKGQAWKTMRMRMARTLAESIASLQVCWFGEYHKAVIERIHGGEVTGIDFPDVAKPRVGLVSR